MTTHVRPFGAILLLGLLVHAPAFAQDADARPNILFILTDDHRPDGMGCFGNDLIRTPNFDRLAAEGARLDRFYVAAPLCCPSRAAFLTGLYPHQNGVQNNQGQPDLRSGTPTVATLLSHAGYVTGFIGKAHMGGDPRRWDFDETPVWLPGAASPHADPRLMVAGEERQVEGMITTIFAESAIDFVTRHRQDRWFLWLASTAPHTPYLDDPDHAYSKDLMRPPPLWPPGAPLPRRNWTGYYSTISMLDEEIGRVLAALETTGQSERTFVFLAGDNGFMQGSHGYPAKSVWYEEATRVPAIARYPGRIAPGSRTTAPVVSVDLFPTLAEIAGVASREALEGESFLPVATGKEPLRKIVASEVAPPGEKLPWQMVREGDLKYVRFQDGRELLYDLATDPNELADLSGESSRAKDLERMRDVHRAWLESTPG